MRWVFRNGSVLCMVAVAGCSVIAVDDVEPQQVGNSAECAELNTLYPTGSECMTWRAVDSVCTIATPLEVCDGQDNDCDGRVDEDSLTGLTVEDAAQVTASNAAFVPSGSSEDQLALYTEESMAADPLGTWLVSALSSEDPGPLQTGETMTATRVAVSNFGASDYVAAYRPNDCPYVHVGVVRSSTSGMLDGAPAVMRDVSGEVECAAVPASQSVRHMAVASDGNAIASVWVDGALEVSCGVPGDSADVVVNGAVWDGAAVAANTGAAIVLGQSNDASPPVVRSLGNSQFMVVFANDAGDGSHSVHARLVDLDAMGAPTVSGSWDFARTESVGDLAVGVGTTNGDDLALALVSRERCGELARVAMQRMTLNTTAGTLVEDGTSVRLSEVAVAQRRPNVVWRDLPLGWLAVWDENATNLVARQVAADGTPLGAAPVEVFTADANGLGFGQTVLSVPGDLASDARVFQIATHATTSVDAGFRLATFECRLSQ